MKIAYIKPQIRLKQPNFSAKSSVNSTKQSDVAETFSFYKGNFRDGWVIGRRLSKHSHRTKISAFFHKLYWSAAKTRIRKKDILPIALAGVGTITPFPGAGLAGFLGGRFIIKLPKYCKSIYNKFKNK